MLRKVSGFFLPRFLQSVQSEQSKSDHRCELMDLSKRHRMAGVLGRRDGQPLALPVNGANARGPGQGLQYQALLIMEPYWVQRKVEMPKPQFDAQKLGDYISGCMKNGGAVTINLGIYQDGSIDLRAADVLKEIRQRIRKE